MNLREEFLALIDALNRNGVEYGVCGGIALAIHGFPRFTKDIDILIRPEDLDRALAVAAEQGFIVAARPLRFDAGTPKEREVRRISKIEGEDVMTLDLLLSRGVLRDAWDDREAFEWQGRIVQAAIRTCSTSEEWRVETMKANNERPPKVDMSPEAIDRRLRELGQLYELGMSLQKAKKIGKVGEAPPKKQEGDAP